MGLATFSSLLESYSQTAQSNTVIIIRFVLFLLLMSGLNSACYASPAATIHQLDQASFVRLNTELPPALDRTDWQNISLPDIWQHNHADYGGSIWYRMHLELDAKPGRLWAVYLPRLNMNAAVFINGIMVGNGGTFSQPMARNWNRPLYFTVPQNLWQVGENTLMIRVQSDKNSYGNLYAVHVGSDAQLRPDYQQAHILQIDVLQLLFVLTLCVSLITFVLWCFRYCNDAMYGWYALGTFLWAIYIQYFFVQSISVSAHTWMWLTFSSAYGMIIVMMFFCQAFMRLTCDWCLKLMPLYGLLISIWLYATPLHGMFDTIGLSFIGIMLFVLFMFGHLIRYTLQHGNLETTLLGFGVLVNVVFGIHDLLTLTLVWSPPQYMLHYGTPVMFLAMGLILVNRFITVLKQSERLNLELDQRVQRREQELLVLHKELRTVERRETILEERERMMEDLHDGMGGQLAAAMSLVDKPDQSALLKQALENAMLDFRLVIDSLDDDNRNIATLLGTLRMRLQPQLQASGIQLRWHLIDGPELDAFSSEVSLHMLRIVQEAITNAVRHADTDKIELSIMALQGKVIIKVCDHGSGLSGEKRGRGISHMHKRAAKIAAQLEINSSSLGVEVCLTCRCEQSAESNPSGSPQK